MIELNILKNEESNHLIRGRVGDIPKKPLVIKIFDDITPLDLTGAIVKFYARTSSGTVLIDVIVKITDPKNGIVEFSLPKNIFSSKGNFLSAYFGISKGAFFDTTNDMNITVLPNVDVSETHAKEVISNIEKLVAEAAEITSQTEKQLVGIKSSIKAVEIKVAELNTLLEEGGFATKKEAQLYKITEDNGSSKTLSGYDLLNIEDIKNFDGYVTTATNSPTVVNNGYFKRKFRTGYIEVTYSPYNANTIYRNAYHFGNKIWFGWEKISYQSDLAVKDTGWLELEITTDFTTYGSEPLIYRTVGNQTYVSGVVTPTVDLEQGTTERLIATLPVGSRPPKTINLICQGTSINKWLLLIKTDGKISASRYGTTKYENMTKGTWLPLAPVVFLND